MLTDAPGGGYMVKLTDPEGFPINLMFGQTPATTGNFPHKMVVNYENEKPRIRRFQRFNPGPAAVHKVCHKVSFHNCRRRALELTALTAWTLWPLHEKL